MHALDIRLYTLFAETVGKLIPSESLSRSSPSLLYAGINVLAVNT